MTRFRVEFSPEALQQARRISGWWHDHRPRAPALFLDELDAAVEQLATAPYSGVGYPRARIEGMRRLLMPRTRHHVYYTVANEQELVRIHAVWSTSRRGGPQV